MERTYSSTVCTPKQFIKCFRYVLLMFFFYIKLQVTIRGPKDDVAKAKKMLADMSNEKQLSSVTAEVRAKPEHHKFLIGRSGANVQGIRDKTGARIIFPGEKDKDRETITILGTSEAVSKAKEELELRIKGLVNE